MDPKEKEKMDEEMNVEETRIRRKNNRKTIRQKRPLP